MPEHVAQQHTRRAANRSATSVEPATSTIATPDSTSHAMPTPWFSSASGTNTSTTATPPAPSTTGCSTA
jgi:hypothetical protein